MQTLWSRAAQAQSSCCCRICQHSTNALTRRSTTAASRRRVTVADLFTACYTTILGTATIIDARRKNQRRQELDGELDRVRTSLKQFDVGGHHDSLDGENGVPGVGASAPRKIPAYITSRRGIESVRPFLEELKSIYNISYPPLARQSWMQDQMSWANIEAAIATEEQNPKVKLWEPLSHQSLADSTAMVLDLVDELLRKTRRAHSEAQIPDHAEEGILRELEDLRRVHDVPSYQFPTADSRYSTHIRARLTRSIGRIFNQAGTLRETVGRICYNLLTVGVPPTIHTYNMLIAGFNRIQRPDLAQVVINSYLDKTTWPATDQTVICMLNHYRGPGGKEGFREVVQRMRGVKGDGLHLATIGEDRDYHNRLSWNLKYPKAKRTDVIFDHLIRGWLYHEEVEIACMTFVACLRSNGLLPVHTLQELFNGCLATVNFSNARKLLVGIDQNFENFKSYLLWIMENNKRAVAQKTTSLHQIINICWLPFGEIFGETHQIYEAAATSLKLIISHLGAELAVQKAASRLPPSVHLEFAISNLDPANLSKITLGESETVYAKIAMLVSIQRRFDDLEERVQNLVAAFNATIISLKTGYNIEARGVLLSDYLYTRPGENQRIAMRRALSQIDVSNDSLTIKDIASQLFRRIPNQDLIRQLEGNDNWKRLSIPTLISFFGNNATLSRLSRPCKEEEEFSQPYQQLKQQVDAANGSIRALIFTHLPNLRQKQVMYGYGGYYNVATRKLRSYLHVELKYRRLGVLQTTSEFQHNEFTTTHDATSLLPQLEQEEAPSLHHPIPFEADNLNSDAESGVVGGWGERVGTKNINRYRFLRKKAYVLEVQGGGSVSSMRSGS
ncbi:hypothetical protein E0Z10_g1510 [Xylaria hypoxylon]|uniref:Pentatricopeptide repeat domain-containing protein n=1 Tax=Xylaria hypoxylon TaxID=37992 RepID=A0A4Z0YT53_9PEZI|nr:hypothetical protein E0Z10_g1510 [Xylaria hypoxylon]